MNKAIISTKESAKSLVLMALIPIVLCVVMVIRIVWPAASEISSYPESLQEYVPDELKLVLLFGIVGCVATVAMGFYYLLRSRTYVEVFEDHIEGIGLQQGIKLMNFTLNNEKIMNVTYRGADVYIHTNGGTYRVSTDTLTAKAIFDHFNK